MQVLQTERHTGHVEGCLTVRQMVSTVQQYLLGEVVRTPASRVATCCATHLPRAWRDGYLWLAGACAAAVEHPAFDSCIIATIILVAIATCVPADTTGSSACHVSARSLSNPPSSAATCRAYAPCMRESHASFYLAPLVVLPSSSSSLLLFFVSHVAPHASRRVAGWMDGIVSRRKAFVRWSMHSMSRRRARSRPF